MWRSLAARSKQVVVRSFCAPQFSQVLSGTQKPFYSFPKTSPSQTPSSLSHFSAKPTYAENGDSQLDDFAHGIEANAEESPSFEGFDSEEIQMESSVSREDKSVIEQETQVYEIDRDKLERVLSLLQSTVDGSLDSSLESMDLDLHLHEDFVLQVLQTPLLLGENLMRFFKWVMKKSEFKMTTDVVGSLVKVICSDVNLRREDAYDFWYLVREIGEKDDGVLNADILNEIISLFSKLEKGEAAVEVLNKFEDFGCVPNVDSYYFTIYALCRQSIYDLAWSVCEKLLASESLPDGKRMGKIISWFCKGGKAMDAHTVYSLAKDKNKQLPLSSVNFLISSLCKRDETVKLALEMLDGFAGESRKYAIKPFSSVVHGLCRMKNVDEAKALVLKMIADGPPPGYAVFNSIINIYSKAGDMDKAKEMIKVMEERGLKPDVYTYTVVMSGYARGGQMDEACEILSEAKKKHKKLSPVTYHTLIRGYCKIEEFDKALKLLAEMKDFGVQPNVDEYNKLIQSLCLKAADWQTAEKLLDEMKENGLHLNGITRSLIMAVKELEAEGVGIVEATTEG